VQRPLLICSPGSSPEAKKTTDEQEVLAWARDYAQKNGFLLNPDETALLTVIRGLLRNETRFGARYCPCRIRSKDPGKDKAIICPCVYHLEEIAQDGYCHCRLYFRKNAAWEKIGGGG
jgi:ferredoxin-thioredoxin reductase catalytic subunit